MKLSFTGGKTCTNIVLDTSTNTYQVIRGVCSGAIQLATQKELNRLEITLVQKGFTKVGE